MCYVCSNGKLVIIGGINSANGQNALADMESVWIYDPTANQWSAQNVTTTSSRFPSAASDLTAVTSKFPFLGLLQIIYFISNSVLM